MKHKIEKMKKHGGNVPANDNKNSKEKLKGR